VDAGIYVATFRSDILSRSPHGCQNLEDTNIDVKNKIEKCSRNGIVE
jgi:hypothetical protein